jgi:hypothetical protein
MRTVRQSLITAALTIALSACSLQAVKHSPTKAAFDANKFLKALYSDEDYAKALELAAEEFRPYVTVENFKSLVEKTRQERGTVKSLKADSYVMMQGKSIELFYTGEYERGLLYHRLVLIGDSSSEYRVAGVWFSPDPYPPNQLRLKFDSEIVAF